MNTSKFKNGDIVTHTIHEITNGKMKIENEKIEFPLMK